MERSKQAPRLTDETKVSSSNELRRHLYLRLICSFLCTPPSKVVLRQKAIQYLGLDLSMICDGITPLKFISKDSLQKLKHACDTRKIEDFLQCLFVESGAVDMLGREEIKFKMLMCKMSLEEYGYYSQIKGNFTKEREDEKQKMLRLLADELDPEQLFEDLFKRHLVEENDREQVMNNIPRKPRMEFLIGRLSILKTNEMLNILLVHCMKHDYQYLKKKINDILGGNTGYSHFTGKRVEAESLPGQKLFTADFTSSIQESTGALKVNIQNRKWHLDNVEANKEEIVIMMLIPDWEPTEEKAITTGKLHQIILIRCLLVLVKDLDVTSVCMYIQQRGILDDVIVRDILEQKTTSEKTRELIKQIQQRDHDTYEKFKECLVQAKQEFLKVMLEEEEAQFAKEIEDTDSSAPS